MLLVVLRFKAVEMVLVQHFLELKQGGGLVATTDLWLAPTVAGMSEIVEFDRRYAEQLYGGMIAGACIPEDA